MQEAERFLRYVVPGLIFFIELFIYLLISRDICFGQLIGIGQTNSIGIAMGIAVSGFLASGALGFLLGAIYYTIVWQEEEPRWIVTSRWKRTLILWLWKKAARLGEKLGLKLGADLRPVLREGGRWLNLICCNKRIETTDLSKRGAWRVVTSYLNMRAETSEQTKGGRGGVNRLSGLVNALGTTCLASLIALISFLTYNVSKNWPGQFSGRGCLAIVVGLFMLFFHYWNYKGVIDDYESLCRSTLLNEFECEYFSKSLMGLPIKIYVSRSDLKNSA